MEPIIDINGPLRYVNGRIVESVGRTLSEELPIQYIERIKDLCSLSGEPKYLGTGSQGSAYKFGNKVLKITKDSSEASGANNIVGKTHPNVYTVYLVARLPREIFPKNTGPYIVVYEYLDYPNNLMTDTIHHLESFIKQSPEHQDKMKKVFYGWQDSNRGKIISLLTKMVNSIKDNGDLFLSASKSNTPYDKYVILSSKTGFSKEDSDFLYSILAFFSGWFGFDSYEKVKNIYDKITNSEVDKFNYLCQLGAGLSFLRNNGIYFTDLKKSNIMQRGGEIVIIDVGQSMVTNKSTIPDLGL